MNPVPRRPIDHIVYAVPDLTAACDQLEFQLGIRPTFGGYHRKQGTKNALLNLGKRRYLEVIAVDHENPIKSDNRWMGVDLIEKPQITRWAIKSDRLTADRAALLAHHPQMGRLHSGQRQTTSGQFLAWEMILPLAAPSVELVPFMVDWRQSAFHPCDQLEEGCELQAIRLFHPDPGSLKGVFAALELGIHVEKGSAAGIEIKLNSPNGIQILF